MLMNTANLGVWMLLFSDLLFELAPLDSGEKASLRKRMLLSGMGEFISQVSEGKGGRIMS